MLWKLYLIFFFSWVENKEVADRMIEILDNLVKLLEFWERLPKSKRPKSKSYEKVKCALVDPLLIVKHNFFSYVAGMVEPFLKKFQTDKPMIPFLFFELKAIVTSLLEVIVRSSVIESCKSTKKLISIDLSDQDNLLPLNKMNVGFAVSGAIKKLVQSDKVSCDGVKKFRQGAQLFIKGILQKLFERCPLGSTILRCSSIFDLSHLSTIPKEKLQERWKLLLSGLMELNIMEPQKCDWATSDFKAFLADELPLHEVELQQFSSKEDRLDEFFFKKLNFSKHTNLSFVVKILLTLSHGQAAVERGFSVNNNIIQTNMYAKTIISKRLIKDHMLANGLQPHTIEITKPLVKAYKSVNAAYKAHLEEEKKKVVLTECEKQAEYINSDIDEIKTQINQMMKVVEMMGWAFVDVWRWQRKRRISVTLLKEMD